MKAGNAIWPPLVEGHHVLTWNLQWGNKGKTWPHDVVMPLLKAHHIGMLQEVPKETSNGPNGNNIRLEMLTQELEKAGFNCSSSPRGVYSFLTYWWGAGPHNEAEGDIVNSFDDKYHIAWFVQGKGRWLVNVHLRADAKDTDNADIRIKDVQTLVERVRSEGFGESYKDEIWLGGDFNTANLEEFSFKLLPILQDGLPGLRWCTNTLATSSYEDSQKRTTFGAKDFLLTNRRDQTRRDYPIAATLFNPPDNTPEPSGHFPVSTGHYQAVKFRIKSVDFEARPPVSPLPRGSDVVSTGALADGHITMGPDPTTLEYHLSPNERNPGENAGLIPTKVYLRYYGKAYAKGQTKTEFQFDWHHATATENLVCAGPVEESISKERIVQIAHDLRQSIYNLAQRDAKILENLSNIAECCEKIRNEVPEGQSPLGTDLLSNARKYEDFAGTLIEFITESKDSNFSDKALEAIARCSSIVDDDSPTEQRLVDQITTGKAYFGSKSEDIKKQIKNCLNPKDRPYWWQSAARVSYDLAHSLLFLAKRISRDGTRR